MDDHLYVAGAYTDIATACLMTGIVVTLLVRFRKCQYDRLFLLVLWLQPASYILLAFSGILTISQDEKYYQLAHSVHSASKPLSSMLNRVAILFFTFEMMKLRKRFTNDDLQQYQQKASRWNILRNVIIGITVVENLALFFINLELDYLRL